MAERAYVHGYSAFEMDRLRGSADTLAPLLHARTQYTPTHRILEAGCGVGAQTIHLRERSPGARIISVDVAAPALRAARRALGPQATLAQADLFHLPFGAGVFDDAFLCFGLEHLHDPVAGLRHVWSRVRPGGAITVIEGDHGSALFHPETEAAWRVWRCLQRLQLLTSGDGHIGRRLFAICRAAGLREVHVNPIPIYCDPSLPHMMDGFAGKTICGMLRGIEEEVVKRSLLDRATWEQGFADLLAVSRHPEGAFSYTFFRAGAVVPST